MTVETVICTIPNCTGGPDGRPWESPVGLQTYASRAAEVQNHLDMFHYEDFHRTPKKDEKKGVKERFEKVETKLDRPELKAQLTNTEWVVFQSQWRRYLESTMFTGIQAIHQLWACLQHDTEVALIHKGADQIIHID